MFSHFQYLITIIGFGFFLNKYDGPHDGVLLPAPPSVLRTPQKFKKIVSLSFSKLPYYP